MAQLSKLQIRAKVLSVISEIKSLNYFGEDVLLKYIKDLSQIEDKNFLFDVFIKEFIKMEESEYLFSACLLKELVSVDYINDKVFENLKSPSLSDDSKYKLVQLLRIAGGDCDYNDIPTYFDDPNQVLDLETKKLLENAVFNPEAMLDFLDFVSAVSPKDRSILLSSLKLDYQGDVLANIVYPILYSDFEDDFVLDAIDILSESKSSLAIGPFKYLVETSNNPEIVNACNIGLKKLKLSGATTEKADEYFNSIIKNTTPAEFFTTIPDGNGNQALLVSRKNENDKYLLSAIVVNDLFGVVDCFGFYNISQDELVKVLGKFYQSEGKYKVTPEYVKYRVQEAVNLTIDLKRKFPYEFICWSPLLCDIKIIEVDFLEYANNNCRLLLLTRDNVLSVLTRDYTLRWFMTPSENEKIKEITDFLYTQEDVSIEELNEKIKSNLNFIFDKKSLSLWIDRLYNLIYLLMNNAEKNMADTFYTILKDDNYFNLFKLVLIQRSIFNYFVGLRENVKDSFFTTNIFKKRNSQESKYDIKKLDFIIDLMKKNWIDE